MFKIRIHHGMDLREAERALRERGGHVEPKRRTGESTWTHPAMEKSLRVNCRRKDASRKTTNYLMKVDKLDWLAKSPKDKK